MKLLTVILSLALLLVSRGAAAELPTRPYEAPLLESPEVPPLPAEYLSDDKAGMSFAYHPSARDRVRGLLEQAEELRAELSQILGQAVLSQVNVRVARGSADFERIVPPAAPRGSAVIALAAADDRVAMLVVSLRVGPSSADDVRATFRRGMALLALDEVAGPRGLPRWFRVGFAEAFAQQASLSRARSLWWASMQQRLLPLVDLDHHMGARATPGSVAVAQSADFVRFLLKRDPGESFGRMLASVREGLAFDQALRATYQTDAASIEHAWREDIAKHKAFVPILALGTGVWIALALFVRLRRRAQQRRDEKEQDGEKRVKVVTLGRRSRRHESGRHESGRHESGRHESGRHESGAELARDSAAHDGRRRDSGKAAKRRDKKRRATQQLPEPDVPKVSHNGRWHTLH